MGKGSCIFVVVVRREAEVGELEDGGGVEGGGRLSGHFEGGGRYE